VRARTFSLSEVNGMQRLFGCGDNRPCQPSAPNSAAENRSKFQRFAFAAFCIGVLAFISSVPSARAQAGRESPARPLITQGIDEARMVPLRGNTRPEARAQNDRGAVSDFFPMEHILLLLRRSPEQEQALEQRIEQAHTKDSPNYHRWMTPQKFGESYGLAKQDLDAVSGWLESHGFRINVIYPSRMVIDFSGTAGQVRNAFRTEIHHLEVKGEKHIANMSDPQIPAALAPAVSGVVSLNDFRPHPMYRMHKPRANYTFPDPLGGVNYALVPADLATIYNLNPLFTAGYSGKGQTIVVIENTDVFSNRDWSTFRSTFGLSSYSSGSFTTVHPAPSSGPNNCTAPGVVPGNDGEAILDAEWASASAPNAAIELASCADSATTFGGLIAIQNLINSSSQPPAIMSISYGECETQNGASANAAYSAAYQQAVLEGVSVFVAAGDSGAAGCDNSATDATHGIGVNAFASTPYNVAVGGTDFSDTYAGTNATYWNSSNTAAFGSAKSYIPEIPWNNSCAGVLLSNALGFSPTYGSTSLCNDPIFGPLTVSTVAGGGGPSACATGTPSLSGIVSGTCQGWPKPSWQSVVGNPSDGVRDTPDVSLFAADGLWSHYYVFCWSDTAVMGGAVCTGAPSGWSGAGGTSFSSPILAGIQALVNQKTASRQGNPNYVYYQLAKSEYGAAGSSSCNSSNGITVGSTCIFYDVTLGDMDVDCTGTADCYLPSGAYGVLSTSSAAYQQAYGTTTGWDFATGIGTVNAANLVNNWITSMPNLAGMWDLRLSNTLNPPPGQVGPTEFAFDVDLQSSTASTEALSNTGLQNHAFTNSVCVASGTGNDATMSSTTTVGTSVTFQLFVDSNESYSMTGNMSADGLSVTGLPVLFNAGSKNCGKNDVGSSFTATLYKPATGTYVGTFTPDASGKQFNATIVLSEDGNFNLTGTLTGAGNSCFSNLSINSNTLASIASGNVLEFYGTDVQGDLVGFVANSGGSADAAGDTTWLNPYVTAVVYAGACLGQTYTDAPFHKITQSRSRHLHRSHGESR
jgi:hypothetical protein